MSRILTFQEISTKEGEILKKKLRNHHESIVLSSWLDCCKISIFVIRLKNFAF